MFDTDDLILAPSYTAFGAAASLTTVKGVAISLTAIDMTAGVDVAMSEIEAPTIRPAALIRLAEFEAAGGAVADLTGGRLLLDGTTWEIANYKRKPMAGGTGELLLILADGDA